MNPGDLAPPSAQCRFCGKFTLPKKRDLKVDATFSTVKGSFRFQSSIKDCNDCTAETMLWIFQI